MTGSSPVAFWNIRTSAFASVRRAGSRTVARKSAGRFASGFVFVVAIAVI